MRIYGGFAAVLALMVATSLLSVFSLDRFAKDYDVAGASARLEATVRDIDRSLLLMRQDVVEFYASGEPALYADARALRTTINAALTDAAAQAATLGSHGAEIERLKSSFEAYAGALAGMAALRGTQFTLVNVTLEQQGEDVQRRLEATASPAQVSNDAAIAITRRLLARFLEVRLDMGRALARHDRALAAATAPNIKSLRSILNAFVERAADIVPQGQATAKAVGEYAAALETADAREQALHDLLTRVLRPAAESLIAQISALVADMKQAQSTLDMTTAHVLQTSRTFVTMAAAGGLVLGAVIAWLIGQSIASGIQAITIAMRKLAEGDQSTMVPRPDRRDELGEMSRALQVFKDNAAAVLTMAQERVVAEERRAIENERVRREAERSATAEAAALVVDSIGKGLERLAAGDLTFRVDQDLPEAYEKLRTDLNSAMSELQSLVTSIVANTADLRAGTGDITEAADDLSRRTEQQAASLQQTAAALDQITTTVQKTADGAKHASSVVSKTRTDATQSGEVVRQAITAMSGIDQSSQQISQIIGVIDEIAFQTNLLALNAGVEAARAGEAGRGFAVVASEVRALAQRSADSAKQIKALIVSSVQQVSTGVRLVGETGEALVRIVAQIGEINGAVAAIAASAHEQAVGLIQVNEAINQMDQVTQQNAAMVQESTAASHTLADDTAELARLTDRFQIGDRPVEGSARSKPKSTRTSSPQSQPALKPLAKRVANQSRRTAEPKRWGKT